MKKAFFHCINAYPNAPDLKGCLNDIADYKATLTAKGFSCTTLSNSYATKTRIINKLTSFITTAKRGDQLAWAYSSHGSYAPDTSGDEADGKDELLCPYDWPKYISDDTVRGILAKLPAGVTLDVFADTCHSGTATRAIGPEARQTTARFLPYRGKPLKRATKAIEAPLNHCLWAACADNQLSNELLIGGKVRGAFSYYMCKALREFPTLHRDALMNVVQSNVAALGISQTPQLECTATEALHLPFG